ncbi:MAG: PD40 domain-containing protein [Sphingobacteriales bacterium]|nr:MAG: PD40 domain-containing protein [Sphingobacteriales bacterium]
MKFKKYILLLCVLIANFSFAQIPDKAQKFYNNAQSFAQKTQYTEAIVELKNAIQTYPTYVDAKIFLAEIYYTTKKYNDCISVLEQAKQDIKSIYPSLNQTKMFWLLADAYLKEKNYLKTRENANLYLSQQKKTDYGTQKSERLIKMATFIENALKNPVSFEPKNLGPNINSASDEYFPVLTPDMSQLFLTRRVGYQEDIYQSKLMNNSWTEAKPMDSKVNTPTENEGSQSISANGNLLFFTACNRPNVFGSCDIFYTYFNGKEWTNATGINKPINTNYWDAQPSFAADGKAMYFSSDRPNGKGGKDIWVSYLDEQLRWSEPQNLGDAINTAFDEQTPFIHPDGKTLYFASNGHIGMGMNDIFMSTLENGKWTTPKNLGYPINTEKDEMGLFVTTDGSKAYFASSRIEGLGNLDIYEFDLPKLMQPQKTTYVKVSIKNALTKLPLYAQYQIIDISSNEVINKGNTNYEGTFIACLSADKNYAIIVEKENFLLHTENFSFKEGTIFHPYELIVNLQPIQKNSEIVLKNIFYETNSANIEANSFAELDKLVEFLQKYKNVKAEISGHTDNTGDKLYNQSLSQKRAQNVVDYLVQKGIDRNRLIAKGYADSMPLVPNISAENKAQNRRTVFKIIE